MLSRDSAECLVRPLKDSLRADVDPRAGGHLPVHHQSRTLELSELLPRCPSTHEIAVRDEHAWRPRMRSEDRDRLATLNEECLVVLEASKRVNNRVKRRPITCRLSDATIDDEVLRTLRDLRIEIVHEHPERGFLLPPLAGDLCPAWRPNDASSRAQFRRSRDRRRHATNSAICVANAPLRTALVRIAMSVLSTRSCSSGGIS